MDEFDAFYATFGIAQLVSSLAAIGVFICWLWVLIKIFRDNHVGLGIFCIVTTFICGFGLLITFVYGWARHNDLGITPVMIAWSVLMGVGLLPVFIFPV